MLGVAGQQFTPEGRYLRRTGVNLAAPNLHHRAAIGFGPIRRCHLPDIAGKPELGAGEILVTSMDRDGTRDGYDLDLIRTIADAVAVPVVASGGVGGLAHLVEGVTKGHASAVLAASIFHFGEATISDAHHALAAAGIPVRTPLSR
jgi:hypothetical protein